MSHTAAISHQLPIVLLPVDPAVFSSMLNLAHAGPGKSGKCILQITSSSAVFRSQTGHFYLQLWSASAWVIWLALCCDDLHVQDLFHELQQVVCSIPLFLFRKASHRVQ